MTRYACLLLMLLGCDHADNEPEAMEVSCGTVCNKADSCDVQPLFGYDIETCEPYCNAQADEADLKCRAAFADLADCIEDVPCDELEDAVTQGDCLGVALQARLDCDEVIPEGFDCGDTTIQVGWMCDGEPDCGNGSDEAPDVCTAPCDDRVHQCADAATTAGNACISPAWVCDGYEDCSDASDEVECD